MKINFTKKEYRALVELLGVADWILHANQAENRQAETQTYREITQNILAHAKEMECEDLVERDEKTNQSYVVYESEQRSNVQKFIEDFEESTFWGELVSRLTARDVTRKSNATNAQKVDDEQRLEWLKESEAAWIQEFEQHGLERMGIGQ